MPTALRLQDGFRAARPRSSRHAVTQSCPTLPHPPPLPTAARPPSSAPPGRVLIIYTGGTMGMTKQNGALAPTRGYLPRRICEMGEMADPEMPQLDLIE